MASARDRRCWSRPSRDRISFTVLCLSSSATRNWTRRVTSPLPTEKFNLNQFGGSFGGPIKKDKTFFFVDYQAKMQRRGVPFTGFVPTTGMTTPDANGNYDFSGAPTLAGGGRSEQSISDGATPFQCQSIGTSHDLEPVLVRWLAVQTGDEACNIVPAGVVNPVGAKVLQLYPTPNANAAGYNYINEPVRKTNEGTWDIRLDHQFSGKDSIFGRFSYDQATNFVPGGSPTWTEQNAFGSNQFIDNHGRNAALSETHVFSATTINQVTLGFNRIFNHILSFGTGTCEAAIIGIPGADLGSKCDSITGYPASLNQSNKDCISCGMTSFLMSNYFAIGDRGFAPYQGGTNVYSISDTLDLVRGKHNIRFGGTFRASQMNVRNNAFQDGFVVENAALTGDDAADLLLGSTGIFAAHDQTFLGGTTGRRWKLFRPFVQDDWRVTNNLTVNLGVAWALATPTTEVQNRQANFDIATLQVVCAEGQPHSGGLHDLRADRWARRHSIRQDGDRAAYWLSWRVAGQRQDRSPRWLWNSPRFVVEPGRAGLVGEPAVLCRSGSLPERFLSRYSAARSVRSPEASWLTRPLLRALRLRAVRFCRGPVNPSNLHGNDSVDESQLPAGTGAAVQFECRAAVAGECGLDRWLCGYAQYAHSGRSVERKSDITDACDPASATFDPGYTVGCGFPTWPYAAPFQAVTANNSVGRARYDSLLLKAETKSTRHGLYALLGYTWSRTFDSGMPDGLGTNPGAIYYPLPGASKLDWGLSQLNLNDSFTASILYDLPFGKGKHFGSNWNGATNAILGNWQVNVIEHATSGFPLFVVDSGDGSGVFFSYNGNTFQRPNQVGDPNKAGPVAANPGCLLLRRSIRLRTGSIPARLRRLPLVNWVRRRALRFTVLALSTRISRSSRISRSRSAKAWVCNSGLSSSTCSTIRSSTMGGSGGSGEQDINASSTFGVINNTVNNARLIQFALETQVLELTDRIHFSGRRANARSALKLLLGKVRGRRMRFCGRGLMLVLPWFFWLAFQLRPEDQSDRRSGRARAGDERSAGGSRVSEFGKV